jgi:Rps23 Pro-64 3,4-dihydroxylase Tpa1-like proline 4-hydroxylase
MYSKEELLLEQVSFTELPFPHFSTNKALNDELAKDLLAWLKDCDLWSYTQTSFYTQYEFSLLDMELPINLKSLHDPIFIKRMSKTLSAFFTQDDLKLVGITAHKLLDGYKMGVHNDFIGREETHRLVIQLNDGWDENNGGYLMLFNSKNPNDVSSVIMPIHNSGLAFEISKSSYHAVSTVRNFERYTLVYTFNSTGSINETSKSN